MARKDSRELVSLRIAVVQFGPQIGKVQENIEKAKKLCRNIKPGSVDLICFPEMVFTGYVFDSAKAIQPYLESPESGPTSKFCLDLAKSLRSYVVAGYPERLEGEEENSTKTADDSSWAVGANSAVMYGPKGEWVGGYRKKHLFETDESWAKPGAGFKTFELPSPLNRVTIGICMDLNVQPPDIWDSLFGPYELASYTISQDSDILILLNSWLDSGTEPQRESDWSTLNFWAARLRPLWIESEGSDPKTNSGSSVDDGKQTVVVVCNRTGEENGKTFAGSSSMFSMRQGSGRPVLCDTMGRKEEGIRIWEIVV